MDKKIYLILGILFFIVIFLANPLVSAEPWNVSSAVYSRNTSIAPRDTTPEDVFFKPDGFRMYVVGSAQKRIFEYNLTEAWNVSSAYHLRNFSTATEDAIPEDVFFKPDGLKIYVLGASGSRIYEYNLTDAWNVSSASFFQASYVAPRQSSPRGLFFKSDGLKVYVAGVNAPAYSNIVEYNLTEAWNVTSLSYFQNISLVSENLHPEDVFFKPDGLKMYVAGSDGASENSVIEYNLTDVWNVSSASYYSNFSVTPRVLELVGVFFKSDGSRMYVVDNVMDSILEYKLISKYLRNVTQKIDVPLTTKRLYNADRDLSQSFSIRDIVKGVYYSLRKPTQSFSTDSLTSKLREVIKLVSQSFNLNNIIERTTSLFRTSLQALNIEVIVSRLANFFRYLTQSFSIDSAINRIREVFISIFQFFTFSSTVTRTGTFVDWNWITNVTTLNQKQAIEQVRVPWELNDNWTVIATSPASFTNVTKNFTLPTDCGNVYVEIDGVNVTGYSNIISNVNCKYQVINNKTLEPTNSSIINITYTTGATTSSEGTWLAYNKRIYSQTRWRNTLTISNPTTHDYTNIFINITTDKYAVSGSTKVVNASGDVFGHSFSSTDGNVNWTLLGLDAGDNYVFTIDYNTTAINLTKVNYTETIAGKNYDIYNVTIDANSTRSIPSVYSYFNFFDTGIIANRFYKCNITDCTEEITNRVDVGFSDVDGDTYFDFVEWFVTSLAQNQSYKLLNDKGLPVEVTISSDIITDPIKPFSIIDWEITITMYNPNAFATEKIYKYEFPLGVSNIELDDIGKNLQYDTFGLLSPYVTIVDKDDTAHLSSVYLSPGETKTFILTYKTDSVTVFSQSYFPTHFEVDEMALISYVLTIKNQAEDTVTDIEHRIPIDYGEDLIVCTGDYGDGCPDEDEPQYDNVTLDTQDEVKGDYKLEIENMTSLEVKEITLSFFIPTVILESIEEGRRSIQGVLTNFKRYKFISEAPFKLDSVRYKSGVKDEEVVKVLSCDWREICETPLVISNGEIKLGAFTVNEEKTVFLWYIEDEIEEPIGLGFIARLLEWGKRFEVTGILKYLIGWFSIEDPETGQLYITTGRLIVLLTGISIIVGGLIIIILRRRRKTSKKVVYKE